MPTISAHVSEDFAKEVETAAALSEDKKVGPWLAKAAASRLESEGRMPREARAELLAAIREIGEAKALELLRHAGRDAA